MFIRLYIKNHYRLTAVDSSRDKELDVHPKAIKQIEFVIDIKNTDGKNADDTQSMFVLTVSEKIKDTRLKLPKGSVAVL